MSLVKQFAVPLFDVASCGHQKHAQKVFFSNIKKKYQEANVKENDA